MNNDNLDVGKSPGVLEKPSLVSGVKKLNKLPLAIIVGTVTIVVLALGYAASTRAVKHNAPVEEVAESNGQGQDTTKIKSMVDGLERNSQNNTVAGAPGAANDPLGQYQPQSADGSVTPQPNELPPLKRQLGDGSQSDSQADQDKQRQQEEKRRIIYGAVTSPTKIKIESDVGYNQNSKSNNGYGATAQNPQNSNGSTTALNGLINAMNKAQGNTETDNDARNTPWLDKADKSYDYLAANKAKPKSPYEVKAGTVIPGVMITGVNSDLPGQILGVVSENVYDTGSGRHLLIPQGSKLVGIYSANVIFGQERVLVAWNRIIFPDAQTLNLGAMPGIDQAGYAGFADQVNNHYMKIFGSAFMMSMITGGIAVSSNNNGSQYTQSTSDQMIASMIQQMGEVGKQMIQKNLNIAPTLEIRPGYKFNIFVTKDMILEPLKY